MKSSKKKKKKNPSSLMSFGEKKILDPRENKNLPGGESNPGLSRDRRGYSPLYYRGLDLDG